MSMNFMSKKLNYFIGYLFVDLLKNIDGFGDECPNIDHA